MKRLEAATVAKFGEQGKLGEGMSIESFVAEFEGAEEKIEGDKATLVLKSKPAASHPPTFKKVGDGWKMDLAELSRDMNSKEMLKIVPMMVAAVDGVAKDVAAGKYKHRRQRPRPTCRGPGCSAGHDGGTSRRLASQPATRPGCLKPEWKREPTILTGA